MTRSELINKITEKFPQMTYREIEKAVRILFDKITASLARGQRVELRGFGAFSVRHRNKRMGRNPRTGSPVSIDSKNVPFFKAGKDLRERLNTKRK